MSISTNRYPGTARAIAFIAAIIVVFAANAAAQKVRLRAEITPSCSSSSQNLKFADIYADGNIAVQGSYGCRGAFIYDLTDPDNPALASWYNPGNNQQFLEAIVIGNRGYFGSGNSGGVHIVNLTDPYNPQLLGIVNSGNGNGHNSIHEMVVFKQNGNDYLIENFNSTTVKVLKVINVTNPASPVFIRDLNPTEIRWVHAMHIRGNRMFTSGWGTSTVRARTEIYDITNIATQTPALLGFIEDPSANVTNGNSMHSSWSSEDGNYLYSCRETSNGNGDVRVYDITNPAAPLLVNSIGMNSLNLNAVTPHNPVVKGDLLYVAWYQAGLQVFDISVPSEPKRVGQYDTYAPTFAQPEEEKRALRDAEPWDMICGSDFVQNALPTTYDGNWAVYPFLGEDKVLAGDLAYGLFVLDVSSVTGPPKNIVSDFDGDHKTDLSVFTPSNGDWMTQLSQSGRFDFFHFGSPGDVIVPGDYDGDGKSDAAVWRPSTGVWYLLRSSAGFAAAYFGLNGDIPVPADYDADGRTDVAVYRPSNGTWYVQRSTLGFFATKWGLAADKPLTGDYDNDGKADLTVFRPSNGVWYILRSTSSQPMYFAFGLNGDKPMMADFDGNGFTDVAVMRPSTGVWYILDPFTGQITIKYFGLAEDIPVPADYDGDGRSDVAVYRPSSNVWYRLNSSDGSFWAQSFGQPDDDPTASSVQPN